MLSLDLAFVSSLLSGGKDTLYKAREEGISLELLQGTGQEAFSFICDFLDTYGALPSREVVEAKTLDGEALPTVSEPAAFFVTQVMERGLHLKVLKLLEDTKKDLEAQKPKQAFSTLESGIFKIRSDNLAGARAAKASAYVDQILAHYTKLESGWRGILTPWPSINEATLGLWPGDLFLWLAKSAVGKSWVAVLMALEAIKQGKKVCFCTTELSQFRITQRLFAVHSRIPYKEFTLGKLNMFSKTKMLENAEVFRSLENLYVVGGHFDFQAETLQAVHHEIEPDMTIFDGAYLLKSSGNNRTEQAAGAFNILKSGVALKFGIPVVATSQLNRTAKATQSATITTDAAALTDAGIWNADLAFGLFQTDEMRMDKVMKFLKLKAREALVGDVCSRWDLENMDFSEIPMSAGDAAEFGNTQNAEQDPNVPF